MEIVTSWMEKGMKKGLKEGKRDLLLRMLRKRLGSVQSEAEARIAGLSVDQVEQLAEALLDFSAPSDLTAWLDVQVPQ